MNKKKDHESVLVDEVLALFEGRQLERFIDGTLGAGGHAAHVLENHPELDQLIGVDQDPLARKIATERLAPFAGRFRIVADNFNGLDQLGEVDGILLDLGISSMQLADRERGFSFQGDQPLDMRMDPSRSLTAAEIVNEWSEPELAIVFRDYGEVPSWRNIVRAVLRGREGQRIERTSELVALLKPVARSPRGKKIDPMTLIFQGLRIAVNEELRVVEEVILKAINALRPGGRLAIITFHGLEDGIVKRLFRDAAANFEPDPTNPMTGRRDKEATVKLLTRKPIAPTREEVARNPRSRSAKLRAVERISS